MVRETDVRYGGLSARAFEAAVKLHVARHLSGMNEDEQAALAGCRVRPLTVRRPLDPRLPGPPLLRLPPPIPRLTQGSSGTAEAAEARVLRSISELLYHYATGGSQLGSWFSRTRASVSRAVGRCSRRSSSCLLLGRGSSDACAESSVQSSSGAESSLTASRQATRERHACSPATCGPRLSDTAGGGGARANDG